MLVWKHVCNFFGTPSLKSSSLICLSLWSGLSHSLLMKSWYDATWLPSMGHKGDGHHSCLALVLSPSFDMQTCASGTLSHHGKHLEPLRPPWWKYHVEEPHRDRDDCGAPDVLASSYSHLSSPETTQVREQTFRWFQPSPSSCPKQHWMEQKGTCLHSPAQTAHSWAQSMLFSATKFWGGLLKLS